MRRITADQLLGVVRAPVFAVVPGTTGDAVVHIQTVPERIGLAHRQPGDATWEITRLIDVLADSEDPGSGPSGGQREVTAFFCLHDPAR